MSQYQRHIIENWHKNLGHLCVLSGVLALMGCDVSKPTPTKEQNNPPVIAAAKPIENKDLKQRRADAQDECPRLVQKRIDSTSVSRQERILGNQCDYFIYPKIGETVRVSVSDSRMKPYLDSPYYHDFANGDYVVTASGRHVIRLEYNALERKPEVLDYELVVEIRPPK